MSRYTEYGADRLRDVFLCYGWAFMLGEDEEDEEVAYAANTAGWRRSRTAMLDDLVKS